MEKVLIQSEPIKNWTLIETVIAVGDRRIPIQDQPMLRSTSGHKVVIKSIELITVKQLPNGVLNAGANISRADLIKTVLVLYSNGWEQVQYIPLARLIGAHDMDATTATTIPFMRDVTMFENLADVDWTKSYFLLSPGQSIAAAGVIVLGIQYQVFNNNGQEIRP
jgi:hypothetical protein